MSREIYWESYRRERAGRYCYKSWWNDSKSKARQAWLLIENGAELSNSGETALFSDGEDISGYICIVDFKYQAAGQLLCSALLYTLLHCRALHCTDKHFSALTCTEGLWTLSCLPSKWDYWENCQVNKLFWFSKIYRKCLYLCLGINKHSCCF